MAVKAACPIGVLYNPALPDYKRMSSLRFPKSEGSWKVTNRNNGWPPFVIEIACVQALDSLLFRLII